MVVNYFLLVIKMRPADLLLRAKNWKQPKRPLTAKWVNKLWDRLRMEYWQE